MPITKFLSSCRYVLSLNYQRFDQCYYLSERTYQRTKTMIPLGIKDMKQLKEMLFSLTFFKDKDE